MPQESDSFLATWDGWTEDSATNLINTFAPEYELLFKESVKKVSSRKWESAMYAPLGVMLNILSFAFHEECLKDEGMPNYEPIVWMVSPFNPLSGDIFDAKIKPDIVATVCRKDQLVKYSQELQACTGHGRRVNFPEINLLRPSHAKLSSPVEVKSSKSTSGQLLNYLSTQLRYRMDLKSVVGLSARKAGYRVYGLDPCSSLCTAEYTWTKRLHLLQYVATVYQIEQGKDDSYQYIVGSQHDWNITLRCKTFTAHPFYAALPLGRMTRTAVAFIERSYPKALYLVKTSFPNASSRFREAALYVKAHSKGYIPGLARFVDAEESDTIVSQPDGFARRKYTIALGSMGSPISECDSVLDLLKVIYDAVVTLEAMVDVGVMHRDISRGNILCKPRHYYEEPGKETRELPYIDGVLRESCTLQERRTKGCHVLVTDLDHGEDMHYVAEGDAGTGRTGTPMSTAIEIAFPYYEPFSAPEQVACIKSLLDSFTHLSREFDGRFEDDASFMASLREHLEQMETDPCTDNTDPPNVVTHHPHHDVESLFWILCFCLVRALPKGGEHMCCVGADAFCDVFVFHTIPCLQEDQQRLPILTWKQKSWQQRLHPKLRPLARMLSEMCMLFRIYWTKRIKARDDFIVHQAFKRILFAEIVDLTNRNDPIPLDTRTPRRAHLLRDLDDSILCSKPTNPSERASPVKNTSEDQRQDAALRRSERKRALDSDILPDAKRHKGPIEKQEMLETAAMKDAGDELPSPRSTDDIDTNVNEKGDEAEEVTVPEFEILTQDEVDATESTQVGQLNGQVQSADHSYCEEAYTCRLQISTCEQWLALSPKPRNCSCRSS